jgi:hypothetical protein
MRAIVEQCEGARDSERTDETGRRSIVGFMNEANDKVRWSGTESFVDTGSSRSVEPLTVTPVVFSNALGYGRLHQTFLRVYLTIAVPSPSSSCLQPTSATTMPSFYSTSRRQQANSSTTALLQQINARPTDRLRE